MIPQSDLDEREFASDELDNESDDYSDDLTSDDDDDGGSDAEDDTDPWIDWYVSLKGNHFFVAVEEDYIRDDFNLTGLRDLVPKDCVLYFDAALDVVLDNEPGDQYDMVQQRKLQESAQIYYGLIHARFILTAKGLQLMHEKYVHKTFGQCPNAYCAGHSLLPIGETDAHNKSIVKTFCPRCNEIYHPRETVQLDGSFFGTTFPHIFCLVYESMMPQPVPSSSIYIPRIYGFRVNKNFKERCRTKAMEAARSASSVQQPNAAPRAVEALDGKRSDSKVAH
eukprot:Selendium_serpulae@DN4706_c0_g1_i1.p1